MFLTVAIWSPNANIGPGCIFWHRVYVQGYIGFLYVLLELVTSRFLDLFFRYGCGIKNNDFEKKSISNVDCYAYRTTAKTREILEATF